MSIYLGNARISPIVQRDTMEAYVKNGGRFGYSEITDLTLYVKPEWTSGRTNMESFFRACSQTSAFPAMDTSSATNIGWMYFSCALLTEVPMTDTSNVTNAQWAFSYDYQLVCIPALDFGKVTNLTSSFTSCVRLEEIHIKNIGVSFDISSSTKFAREALVEIIGNLKTVTTNQTLTMGATNLAKLTEADRAVATGKGWTLA